MVRNGYEEMEGGLNRAWKSLVRGQASASATVKRLQAAVDQETASSRGPGGEGMLWLGPTGEGSDLSR